MGDGRETILTDEEVLTGAAVAALVSDMRGWVHRRVEQIEVIDDVAVVRRASIDLTVPHEAGGIETAKALVTCGQPFVPLTFLKKQPLRGFDLRDAAGVPLPMLSRRENGAVATSVLVSQAEAILGCALPSQMLELLHLVAEAPEDAALEALARWRLLADDPREEHREKWQSLVSRHGFVDLAEAFVGNFLVCAVTDPASGTRRIFKIAYEQPFGHESRSLLAWRWKVLQFDAPQSVLADSYHFEMAAPVDMELDAGWLRFTGGTPQPKDNFDLPEGQRVHLYASQLPSDTVAEVRVWLRARSHGNLRAAFLTSLLCSIVLWILFGYRCQVTAEAHNQIAAGLLLLGPTLLTAALVRPGEHRLVTSIFFWVRLLTVTSMLACLTVAGLLAGVAPEQLDTIWVIAATTSSVSTGGLILALLGPIAD